MASLNLHSPEIIDNIDIQELVRMTGIEETGRDRNRSAHK